MRKGLLGLIVAGLLCWAGQAVATTINLDNGIAKYTIVDGVVTNGGSSSGPDLLNQFTFVLAYNSPVATSYTNVRFGGADTTYEGAGGIWSPLTGNTETKYYFRKQLTTDTGVAASMGVDYMLLPGKRYLDVRYFVYVSPGSISKVRAYLVMEPNSNVNLGNDYPEHPGSSQWQMINDQTSSWFGGTWPAENRVLVAGQAGFCARVADDDYMGNSVANVDARVNPGLSLASHIPGAIPIVQASPGAVAMRIPTTPAVWGVPTVSGDPRYIEARLEVVPEPCTMGLMLAGLAGLGAMRRRNRKS